MRYLKLYEGFFDKENIGNYYDKNDILNIMQELVDDYSVDLSLDNIYYGWLSDHQFVGCEPFIDLSKIKIYYFSAKLDKFNSYCIYISTLIDDTELRNFLNNKAMLYDFNYILARYKGWIKIFIYKEI